MQPCTDFRSDTVTLPTQQMRDAMATAEVGDDILGEDPTVDTLEALGARMLGKEASLFVVSGTMANQLAVMTATQLGDEILVAEESHIYNLEVAGMAALSGVQARTLKSVNGRFNLSDLDRSIRSPGVQFARTRMLCLENTFDLNRGIPLPPSYIAEVAAITHRHELFCYMDGARLFNASVALNVPLTSLCADVDAVMVALTKGLAAPIGALLCGSVSFVERARWMRQRIGGGMRQAGHMAAAGIVGLETMMGRLEEDHQNAKRLVEGLMSIDPSLVEPASGQTNVVQLRFDALGIPATQVVEALLQRGIKIKLIGEYACRMVTHWGICRDEVDLALREIRTVLESSRKA
ncbi:MAG: GntG family PLP-dependent aldolase [Bacillota bacterium]